MDPTETRIRASFATDSDYNPPAPAGMIPYPFQRAGVDYAVQSFRDAGSVLVADEMGLGKTIQGLCAANALGVGKVLVVCPASLRINWRREAERWLLWADATVIGYEELVRRGPPPGRWPLVIFDEAQYLKTPEARRTKAALSLPAERRVFLSGTPIVNRPIELWPMLHAIDPKAWGSRHEFGVRYCGARHVRFGNTWTWQYQGATNLVELQKRLRASYMVRRLKKDVLKDLPPKVRQIVEIPGGSVASMATELLRSVGLIAEARRKTYQYDPEKVRQLKEAQQTVFEELARVRHEQALIKVPKAVEHIRDMLDAVDKIVVFAHHRDVLDALFVALEDYNPVCVRGGMSDAEKQQAVDAFQNVSCKRIFLGQIHAAGVGLTLTAAQTVVFVELDWTPGGMAQCEDRCHRIGQKGSVLVQHLVLEGSLDAKISKALLHKQGVIDRTLDSGDVSSELDWVQTLAQPEGSVP